MSLLEINPGDLRHRITIQVPDTSQRDAAGNPISTWVTILTTRAKIESATTSAYRMGFSNDALDSQSTDIVTIRYPGNSVKIEPGQRVIFGDNVYVIQSVDNVQHRNRKLQLSALNMDESS